MCAEKKLVVGNSWSKEKDVRKYTWLRMAEGRMVDRALMDYVLLPKRMLVRVLDVTVWRGEGGVMSDHRLVEPLLKLVGGSRRAGRMEGVRNVFQASELNNCVKERACTRRACLENMKCGEVG